MICLLFSSDEEKLIAHTVCSLIADKYYTSINRNQ